MIAAALLAVVLTPAAAVAQNIPEYRAIWVETFNTPLGLRANIDKVIGAAVDARANAIATVHDAAGRTASVTVQARVPHDRR